VKRNIKYTEQKPKLQYLLLL